MALDLMFPLLNGKDSRFLNLKSQAQESSKTPDPVLLWGARCMAADQWAQLCAGAMPAHYSLKSNEGLLGESHLWSSLRALMESGAKVLYFTGFSELDPILQASLLDWLQTQGAGKKIILQMDAVPVAALQELSFYKRARVLKLIPLKERLGDIAEIVNALIKVNNDVFGKEVKSFEPQLLEWWQGYNWPGDLLELEGMVLEMLLRSQSEILKLSDLNLALSQLRGSAAQREKSLREILKEAGAEAPALAHFLGQA